MRILQVHKYLYRKAGAEAYVLDLVELLKAHGHEVMMWGTDHNAHQPPLILRGGDRESLVRHLNFGRREGLLADLKKFGHMVWSFEAARKFERVLKQFQPEVVHVHNIYHHISPSILKVAARYRIPVVMTVHDYHLVNPNYTLYDHGAICERRGFSAIAHRCVKNSFVASAADVVEWQIHQWLGIYRHTISRYLAPTEFVKEKLTGRGIPAEKIVCIPLPVILNGAKRSEGSRTQKHWILRAAQDDKFGDYILYAGRITEEKGIYLVLELAKRLPEIKFKIAGAGSELENVKCKIKNEKLLNVELLGFVERPQLQELIDGARLVVVPSLWYDPSPLAVLEAMAAGKVVVASRIGGIPELIEDGKTGFLIHPICHPEVTPKDPAQLRTGFFTPKAFGVQNDRIVQWIDAIKKIYYDEALRERIGNAAQEYVRRVRNPEKHYARLMKIYEETINRTHRTY